MKTFISILISAFLLISMGSCDDSQPTKADKSINSIDGSDSKVEDLVGKTWKLSSFQSEEGEIKSIHSAAEYVLTFSAKDSVDGTTSCNEFWGVYEAKDGGEIDVEITQSTLVECPDESNEDEYTNALQSADEYEVNNDELRLGFEAKGVITFENQDSN